MSTLNVDAIVSSSGANTATVNGTLPLANTARFGRNLIINGAMQVAQRATSSSAIGYQTVDRFRIGTNATDELAMTQAQVSDSPDGFSNSFKVTITTPESAFTTTEWFYTRYTVEAQDAQQLAYGTSSAKKTTLSFYVKSSVTGNYAVLNFNGTSTRSQTLTYTINAANTWERKTITFDGDTTGSYPNSNAAGPDLYFTLSAGPDNKTSDGTSWGAYASAKAAFGQTADVGSTNAATWQITGVQLEVGDTATDFEHRYFAEELQLCSRYFQKTKAASDAYKHFGLVFIGADAGGTSYGTLAVPLVTTMRGIPALITTGSVGNYALWCKNVNTALSTFSIDTGHDYGTIHGQFYLNAFASVSAGAGSCGAVRANNTSAAFVALDAEL